MLLVALWAKGSMACCNCCCCCSKCCACSAKVCPARVAFTPVAWRVNKLTSKWCSNFLIRSLAACKEMAERSAPLVKLPVLRILINNCRSKKSRRMAGSKRKMLLYLSPFCVLRHPFRCNRSQSIRPKKAARRLRSTMDNQNIRQINLFALS